MKIGSIILHSLRFDNSKAPVKLPPDLQAQIRKLMDNLDDEGFFSHSFKTYMTANLCFKIPSVWARGNWELLCLSVITKSKKPELFKDALEAGVVRIKAIPELYKAFHGEKQVENEDFKDKQQELKEFLASLCEDLRQAKKQGIAKAGARERKRNQTRDRDRDQVRDHDRDQYHDSDRNQIRDYDRDQTRDHDRDQTRDHDRDQTRDHDRDQTRDRDQNRELPLRSPAPSSNPETDSQRLTAQTPTIQASKSKPGKKRKEKPYMPPERHLVFKAGSDMLKKAKQEKDDESKQEDPRNPDEMDS